MATNAPAPAPAGNEQQQDAAATAAYPIVRRRLTTPTNLDVAFRITVDAAALLAAAPLLSPSACQMQAT